MCYFLFIDNQHLHRSCSDCWPQTCIRKTKYFVGGICQILWESRTDRRCKKFLTKRHNTVHVFLTILTILLFYLCSNITINFVGKNYIWQSSESALQACGRFSFCVVWVGRDGNTTWVSILPCWDCHIKW